MHKCRNGRDISSFSAWINSRILGAYPPDYAVIFKDDFEYFSELSIRIGKWAKNDLYNFVEIFPPNKKVEVDAIKVYIGDTPAYLFADKPTNVLRFSYVSRRKGKDSGYQRMVDFSRISKIAKSIREKKIEGFPNSILLNSTVELEEMEKISKSHCPKSVKLLLPDHYSSCRIVDGQHRLISFSQLSEIEQSRFTLSIVLMNNLPLEQEKKMFLDINNNAKNVDPNLEYEIFSELNCWEKGSKEEMIKLSIKIINEVERVKPLKGRLYRGRINEDKGEQVTIKSFTDSILRYKVVDKETGRFQNTENDLELPVKIFKSILAESYKKISDKDYLISNRGIDLVCNFWANVFDTTDKSTWQESIDNNIEDFTSAINDSIEPLRKLQGATGFKEAFDIIKKSIEKKSQVQEIAIAAATAVTLREHPLEKEGRPG